MGGIEYLLVLENLPACYYKYPKLEEGGGSLWDFAARDFYGKPLDLNCADSTFMNHRGVIFALDQSLATEIQGLLVLCRKEE